MIVTVFVCCFALCLIYLFNATPIYQATTRLQIDPEAVNVLNLGDPFQVGGRDQEYLVTQYKNLQSPKLVAKVVESEKLEEDPRYMEAEDKISAVMGDLTVSPIRLSRLVDLKVEHPDATKAAEIANAMASQFVQDNVDSKREKVLQALKLLRDEADKLDQQVKTAEQAVQDFIEQSKMSSLDASRDVEYLALEKAQLDYEAQRGEASKAVARAESARAYITEAEGEYREIPEIANDQRIKELTLTLSKERAVLANLKERFRDKWPQVIAQKGTITELVKEIDQRAKTLYDEIQSIAVLALRNESDAKKALDRQEQRYRALSEQRIKYKDLKRKSEVEETMYQHVLKRFQETDISSNDDKQNIFIVYEAAVPFRPVKPRKALVLLMGLMGGIAVSVGLALFVNYLDDSIKSQDDVETYLRQTFLGYIPNIKTNSIIERDLQAHLQPQATSSEGFRTLRAALALQPSADRMKVLSVTSTIPSEGKSLVASNLAIVIAQTGASTLLIDADLRRPSVHKAFQLQSPVGLAAYLQEETASADEIVHATEVPNLDIVCCGAIPKSPSELIGSKKMSEFLNFARNRYDRVIVDCPPVSAVSDPLVISAKTDGILYVTKFNKIRRDHARKSIQRVENAGVHLTGVVVNDIDFEGKDSYYYSYYYYQNRYYATYKNPKKDREETNA